MNEPGTEAPISLVQYQHITRNSPDSLQTLLRLTIEHFQNYKVGFAEALLNRDEGKLGDLSHKIKMTLYILDAKELEEVISKSRRLVATAEQAQLQQAIIEIQRALDRAVTEMKKHLPA